jgi:hypothetical protein
MRPLDESGSPAFACGNSLVFPTFDIIPGEVESASSDVADSTSLGWASSWIDLGGEG